MNTIRSFTCLFLVFMFSWTGSKAQIVCTNVVTPCTDAIPVCDIQINFTSPNPHPPGPFPGCPSNVIDNELWHRFIPLTPSISFSITSSNCQNGGGIQAGLYSDCANLNSPIIPPQCGCTTGPITFTASVTPGEEYFLLVDGCAGDICDVEVTIISGMIDTNIGGGGGGPIIAEAPYGDDFIVCDGLNSRYFCEIIGPGTYNWLLDGGQISSGIITPGDCNTTTGEVDVIIDWVNFSNMPSDDCFVLTYEYIPSFGGCGSPANAIESDPLEICFDDILEIRNGRFCPFEEPFSYLFPEDGFMYIDGIYNIVLYDSLSDCPTYYELTVTSDDPELFVYVDSICFGQCLDFRDTTFCDPGSYTYLTYDSVGQCDTLFSVYILDLLEDTEFSFSLSPDTCPSNNQLVSLFADVTGSDGPYSYIWSTGEITPQIDNISPGTYTLTITANNGCSIVDSAFIGSSFSVDIIQTSPACIGIVQGALAASISGAINNPIYQWSNGGQDQSISNLSTGNYELTITDDLTGCTATNSFFLQNGFNTTGEDSVNYSSVISPQGFFYAETNEFYTEGTYILTLTGRNRFGCDSTVTLYVVAYNGNQPITCEPGRNSCENGQVLCSFDYSFTLPPPDGPPEVFPDCPSNVLDNQRWFTFIPLTSNLTFRITSTNCVNSTGIQAGIYTECFNVNSALIPPQCACTTGPIIFSDNGFSPGNAYYLLVDGCAGDICDVNIILEEGEIREDIDVVIDSIPSSPWGNPIDACPGEIGTFYFEPDPNAVSYQWLVPSGYEVIDANCSRTLIQFGQIDGPIAVEYTYKNCVGDTVRVISDSLDLTVGSTLIAETGTYCPGGNPQGFLFRDGNYYLAGNYTIILPGIDSTSCDTTVDLTVELSNNDFVFDVTNCDLTCFTFGSLEVCSEVTDSVFIFGNGNGCDSTVTLTLNYEDLNSLVSLVPIEQSCDGSMLGSISVDLQDVSLPVNYQWSTGSTQSQLTGLAGGTYTLTLTSAVGCTYVNSVTLRTFDYFISSSSISACDSSSTGIAQVSLSGDFVNPSYEWNTGETASMITGLVAGTYTVTVTDTAIPNCTIIEEVQINIDNSCYVNISGYVYNDDVNEACLVDNSVMGIPNVIVQLEDGTTTLTDQDGFYSFFVAPGARVLSISYNTQLYEPICADDIAVNALLEGGDYPQNDFFLGILNQKDLGVSLRKNNFPQGIVMPINLTITNYGDELEDGITSLQIDPRLVFVNAIPAETNFDGGTNTISWSFSGLAPAETRSFNVYLRLDQSLPNGTPLPLTASIGPVMGDVDLSNNSITCDALAQQPFDPNIKTVTPQGSGSEGFLYRQDNLLNYQITFQNTGQANAQKVVVLDTLEQTLDLSTFIPGGSSHPYSVRFINSQVLEFTFDNINLPPAFIDFPGSIAQFSFQIKYKDGLPFRTRVTNSASVYFDDLAPVMTNTTLNTIIDPSITTSTNIDLCPGSTYQGVVYNQSTTLTETFSNSFYDSISIININVFPVQNTQENVSVCTVEQFMGQLITNNTIITEQRVDAQGCGYTYTFFVTALTTFESIQSVDICSGDAYEGIVYNSDTSFIQNFIASNGCDSTVTTNIQILDSDTSSELLELCEGTTYRGQVITDDIIFSDTYTNIEGCDSVHIINVVVLPTIESTRVETLCSGDSYNGVVYTTNTTIVENYIANNGCDSVVIVNILINPTDATIETVEVCEGSLFRGLVISFNTIFTDTYTNEFGCDSIHTTNVITLPVYQNSRSVALCSGETYNGVVYTNDTTLQENYITSNGCDSVVVVDIQVLPNASVQRTELLCSGDSYNGVVYTSNAIVQENYTAANGCDSLLTVNIEIEDPQFIIINVQACEGDIYRGQVLTRDTSFVDNLVSVLGCDSTVTTNVAVADVLSTQIDVELCPGETYNGLTYMTNTVLTESYTSTNGCDSVVNTNIYVLEDKIGTTQVEICPGELYQGFTILRDTAIQSTLIAANGCDSIHTTFIEVLPEYNSIMTVSVCEGSIYQGVLIEKDTQLSQSLTAINGCDSVVIYNLMTLENYEVNSSVELCAGESYRGKVYTTNDQLTEEYVANNGCDSTVNTSIMVSAVFDQVFDVELCRGDVYLGRTIINDTIIIQSLLTVENCDSIVTTNIQVRNEINRTFTVLLCQGSSYDGIVYEENDTLSSTFTSVNGCDSVVSTFIFIQPIYDFTITEQICEGETYDGQVITQDTIIEYALLTNRNCDSLVTVELSVIPTTEQLLDIELCPGDTFEGVIYTRDTSWTASAVSSDGCDSITQVQISILEEYTTTIDTVLSRGDTYRGQVIDTDTTFVETLIASNGCDSLVITNIMITTTTTQVIYDEEQFEVFPNPTEDLLILKWEKAINNIVLEVYDVNGQLMIRREIQREVNQYELSMKHLAAGTYLIRVKSDTKQWLERIVKM